VKKGEKTLRLEGLRNQLSSERGESAGINTKKKKKKFLKKKGSKGKLAKKKEKKGEVQTEELGAAAEHREGEGKKKESW